jgi:tetratricopeptide (TPR) repeat protein
LVLGLLLAGPANAQQKDEDAKAAYVNGKAAYESKRYDVALEHFKRSYVLSGQPALLYNIASTLQQLGKPGLAAQALRDFLTARPNDPERTELESRIANLEQAQSLIERDENEKRKLLEQQNREREHAIAVLGVPGWLSESEADRRLLLVRERERKRRRNLAIGLGVGLGAIAVGAIAVGVLCGTGHCSGNDVRDFDFSKTAVSP